MGWYTKPAEQPACAPTESLWAVCPGCKAYVPRSEWNNALRICPRCGHHDRMTCRERVALVCDAGSFSEINAAVSVRDPLQFADLDRVVAAADARGEFLDDL